MICTEGYRDVIEIRRSNKEDLWDTYKDVAQPYIRRRDRLTVRERIDHGGRIDDPARRGGRAREGPHPAQARRGCGRRLLHELLHQPGA